MEQLSGEEVLVTESTERWSEFTLSDGAVLRAKVTINSAVRSNEYDDTGRPRYGAQVSTMIAVVSVPSQLKRVS